MTAPRSRFVWFFLVFLILGGPLHAQDKPTLSMEVGASFLWGSAYELVLRDGTYNNPISLLTWPVSPVAGLEMTAKMPWTDWTTTLVGLRVNRALVTGTMTDEDWNYGDLIYGRSEHESHLTNHFRVQWEQQFHWKVFALSTGAFYRLSNWEGWNGWYQYRYTDTTSTKTFQGLVIDYRQEWIIPYLGASWTGRWGPWTVIPALRFGSFAWCYDRDDHLLASNRYTFFNNVPGGFYGAVLLEITLEALPQWQWGLRGGWEAAGGGRGDTANTFPTSNPNASYTSSHDAAGVWFHEASLTLFVRN